MKVIKQFLREFSIPTILSIIWTYYNWKTSSENSIGTNIKNFASAFFLSSWFVGQILRIIKQQKVERGLSSILTSLEGVANKLEDTNQEISNSVIGSSSFVYMSVANINASNDEGLIGFITGGTGPVYDCRGWFVNIDEPQQPNQYFNIGELPEGSAVTERRIFLNTAKTIKINCFFSTRRGHFNQILRMKFVENKWQKAIHVSTFKEIIYSKISPGFPLESEEEKKLWNAE